MTQCNQKMKVKAVMTISGRSLTSGDLCAFLTIFWNHFHSWNTLATSFCSYFPVWDILHFTGDGSGMSICKSSYWPLVGIWTKCNRTILAKCWTFYWCLCDDLFLQGNLLFTGHLSCNGGDFSAEFQLGRRLHFSAGGYASFWGALAFRCGSRPAQLFFSFLGTITLSARCSREL